VSMGPRLLARLRESEGIRSQESGIAVEISGISWSREFRRFTASASARTRTSSSRRRSFESGRLMLG
jgi:hypothetical protein